MINCASAYHEMITDVDDKPIDFIYIRINAGYETMTGLKSENLVGKRFSEIESGMGQDINWIEFFGNAVSSGQPAVVEYYSERDNHWYFAQVIPTEKGCFISNFIDITQLKRRESELVKSYEELVASKDKLNEKFKKVQKRKELLEISKNIYKEIINNSEDIEYIVNIKGLVTFVNRKFCEMAKQTEEQIIGNNISQFLSIENAEIWWNSLLYEITTCAKLSRLECAFKMRDGSVRNYQVTLSPISDTYNKIIGVLGINHDITIQKQNEQKIIALAYFDSLTNLPNRNLFLDRLKNSISISKRNRSISIVAIMDIDDFEKVKNTLGREIGDKILIEVANRLVPCMREYDTVARLTEDKFLFLCQNIRHINEVCPIIDRINAVMNEPFNINKTYINITASIGISVFPDDGESAEDMLVHAEEAMYKAKKLGKSCFQFYNKEIKERIERIILLENRMNIAITNHEFVLFYQPQYEAKSRRLRGFEALIRWNNPEVGLVKPMEFIPVSEETGQIVSIGKWVLDTACQVCNKIKKEFGLNLIMSVNISVIQLKHNDFYDVVMNAIKNSEIKASNLELEVTESIFMDNCNNVVDVLTRLKAAGVRITLADFGTGNLSFGHLDKLPITMVKLDKDFIHEIDHSSHQAALTESIISLVHKLNIEMLAEGIETKEQLGYLIKGKCDNIQGYFLAEPVPEETIGEVITKGILENENSSRQIRKVGLTYENILDKKPSIVGVKWDIKQ